MRFGSSSARPRTLSGYLARIAETQVDALAELRSLQLREGARAEALELGLERSAIGWLIMCGLRRRLDEAIKRRGSTEVGAQPVLVVGFVDLVDFTRASSGLDAAESAGCSDGSRRSRGTRSRRRAGGWSSLSATRQCSFAHPKPARPSPRSGSWANAAATVYRLRAQGWRQVLF